MEISDERASDDLVAAERAGAAMAAHVRTPWPVRATMAVGVGALLSTRGLPTGWVLLRTTVELMYLAAMIVALVAMKSRGARRRAWGGPAWLAVCAAAALAVLAVVWWPEPQVHGFQPVFVALGVTAAVVLAVGDAIADRLWFRHRTRG